LCILAKNVRLSTGVLLENRKEVSLENVLDHVDDSDGLGAFMLRMGAGMKTAGLDPKVTGGQFYLVVNGSLQFEGVSYPAWSTIYASPTDMPLAVYAGPWGSKHWC
jgi:hypothetical protein